MTDPTNDFSRPAIKVADCMAVVSRSPGVNPVKRLVVAAAAAVGLACDGTPPAAGVPELVTPPSNTGVNKILSLAQGIK